MVREDDEAWRSIVDNYGERAQLDAHEHDVVDADDEADREADRDDDRPTVFSPRFDDPLDDDPDDPDGAAARAADPERFVPPSPPPMPRPSRDRFAAWAGVFGAPAVLLVFVVLGTRPPELLSYALVAAFVGGFLYLVLRMSREPRDPWDDGAQV